MNKRTAREIAYSADNAAHRVQLRALHALDMFGASDETLSEQRALVAGLDARLDAHEDAFDALRPSSCGTSTARAEADYDNDPMCN